MRSVRILDACAECGRGNLPHAARGLCRRCYKRWKRASDPDYAARERASSVRWKDGNRGANRARDREFLRTPEMRGVCVNGVCGQPRGIGMARVDDGYCKPCVYAIADVRRTLAEGMWADDWPLKDMAAAFGVTKAYFSVRRIDRGWDLPYRYRNTKRQLAA